MSAELNSSHTKTYWADTATLFKRSAPLWVSNECFSAVLILIRSLLQIKPSFPSWSWCKLSEGSLLDLATAWGKAWGWECSHIKGSTFHLVLFVWIWSFVFALLTLVWLQVNCPQRARITHFTASEFATAGTKSVFVCFRLCPKLALTRDSRPFRYPSVSSLFPISSIYIKYMWTPISIQIR